MRKGTRPYTYKRDSRERYASSKHAGAPGDRHGLMAAMHRYLEHLGMMGSTEQGLHNQERFIRDFIVWADERGVTHAAQVSRQVLERYQRWLFHYRKKDGQPLHLRTQRCKVYPLKGLFRWLTKTAEIPANPAADLDMPRQIRTIPRSVLTAEEAERVLALPDLSGPVGLRDRAIMELFYATGIRKMELVRLACDDIDPLRCALLIRQGKGQKDRMVPMGERSLHWVQRYLHEARPQLQWDANERTLFLGREGLPLISNWLSTAIGRYFRHSGVGKKGGCHLWRHTMATLMLEGGADVRYVQAMLGHTNIVSTQIYTQVALRQLSLVHARSHPGARRRPPGLAGAQLVLDLGIPSADANASAEAFLEALAHEAEDEANDTLLAP
jgi:integrase/recombinase XerD